MIKIFQSSDELFYVLESENELLETDLQKLKWLLKEKLKKWFFQGFKELKQTTEEHFKLEIFNL